MRLKRHLGQHFLKDARVLSFIASRVPLRASVVEIGGGSGRLTSRLLLRKPSKLYVIEVDDEAFERLKERFSNVENIFLIKSDFLDVEPFKVNIIVGNIPYYISSKILFKLKEWTFDKSILMFQKEFVDKMVAKPGDKNYGRLSVTSNLYFKVKKLRNVSKRAFFPMPKVDSAIVELVKRDATYPNYVEDLIVKLFSQKNKKVKNILDREWCVPEEIRERRPRHLSIDDILNIKPCHMHDEGENPDK